jgi:DNA repair exonuclease SbcCD ATPase subunit
VKASNPLEEKASLMLAHAEVHPGLVQEDVAELRKENAMQKEESRKQKEVIKKNQEEIAKNQEEIAKNQEEIEKNQEEIEKNQEEIEKNQEEIEKNQEEIEKNRAEVKELRTLWMQIKGGEEKATQVVSTSAEAPLMRALSSSKVSVLTVSNLLEVFHSAWALMANPGLWPGHACPICWACSLPSVSFVKSKCSRSCHGGVVQAQILAPQDSTLCSLPWGGWL